MDMSEVGTNELLQAHEIISNCCFNFVKPMSLKCAIELGIPDIINNTHDRTITLTNLIAKLPIHPSKSHCIRRLMRILVHFGFFTTDQQADDHQPLDEERYSLTLVSRFLLKDSPMSATSYLLCELSPLIVTPWHSLSTWMKSSADTSVFEMVYGMNFWERIGCDPELKDTFTEAMTTDTHLTSKIVLDECRHVFEGLESLVDAGGGTGVMAQEIAKAFPEIQCSVLDLPYLVANAQGSQNLSFIEGDIFKAIPQANAVLLKSILHDWSDEESMVILKRCREAIEWSKDKGGKIIIIEMVIGESQTPKEMKNMSTETQLCFDMSMMVLAGRERNRKEWENLFNAAGFSRYKISPIAGLNSLIELYP